MQAENNKEKELEVDEVEQDYLNRQEDFDRAVSAHEDQYLNSFADR